MYKNQDHLREDRLYGYVNQTELDTFLEAMRLRDIGQSATAVRTFVIERSQQIITDHSNSYHKSISNKNQTVTYRFGYGNSTVMTDLISANSAFNLK